MRTRLLSAMMAAVLLATAPGCATTMSAAQRRECRQLRGRTVGRAIGVTLGAIVVLGVVVIAAAAGGSSPSFGGGRSGRRRHARRAERLAACRETRLDPEAVPTHPAAEGVEYVEVADIPIVAAPGGPPSVEELDAAIATHADAVRACQGPQAGTLYVDARIDGREGAVTGVLLHGPAAVGVAPQCVFEALGALRVRPFEGLVDVRWAVDVTGQRP